MQRVLKSYQPGDELEVRYYVDPRAPRPTDCIAAKRPDGFKQTVEAILAKLGGAGAARHRRIIDLAVGTTRKRIMWDAAGQRTEEWCIKERRMDWVEPNDFGGLRVAVASERPTTPVKWTKLDRITIKYRLTFALDANGDPCPLTEAQRAGTDPIDALWLLDVSATKTCDLSAVQDVKTRLLACYDPLEAWAWWDHWEFERELNQSSPVLISMFDIDDIYYMYNVLAPGVAYDMLDAVRRAAVMIQHPRAAQFQRMSPRNTITRLLPRAVEPTLECWIEQWSHAVRGMILRDKIDGVRELIWISEGRLRCIGVRTVDEWEDAACRDTYIFDAEYQGSAEGEGVWYVLHPLVWRGECVVHLRDSERLALLADMPDIPGVAVCPHVVIRDPATDIARWWRRRVAYPRDGLILAEDRPYFEQTTLKWKPANESTVDMLIVQCPEWLMGKAPYVRTNDTDTLYILNTGVNASTVVARGGFPMKRYLDVFHLDRTATYVPQPFSPPDRPTVHVWSAPQPDLHGQIGEFIWAPLADQPEERFVLRRLRADKPSILRGGAEIGNDIRTVLDIWSKIANPFPIEYLWQPPAPRASPYDALAGPVEAVIADLVEEEAVSTAIVHMCPFVPFTDIPHRAALLPRVRAGAEDTSSDYRVDLSNNSRVQQINYDQIGRVELPKDFIGGAQLLVTMDPELLGHVSCLGKLVAGGGRMVVICRTEPGDHPHPEVCRAALTKDLDRAGFTPIADHDLRADAWDVSTDVDAFSIMSFRKENRGTNESRPQDVVRENPHLAANPEANYLYKFSRQKTKDIAGLIGPNEDCGTLVCNPLLGELLVDVEFLSTLNADAQVYYVGRNLERLRCLFPRMQFRTDDATADNIEAVVSHTAYEESMRLVQQYEPHCGMLDFSHTDLTQRVFKGRMMLHPFAALDSTRVSLMYGRDRQEWHILPDIFQQEMRTFHQMYRATAFKYATKRRDPVHGITLDNCYDCRACVYIMTKYARAQKITLDEAFARLA